jgi:hypothetical protein
VLSTTVLPTRSFQLKVKSRNIEAKPKHRDAHSVLARSGGIVEQTTTYMERSFAR